MGYPIKYTTPFRPVILITLKILLTYALISLTLLLLNLIILLDIKALLEILFVNLYRPFIAYLCVIAELVR